MHSLKRYKNVHLYNWIKWSSSKRKIVDRQYTIQLIDSMFRTIQLTNSILLTR